jgi:hypothetical protein
MTHTDAAPKAKPDNRILMIGNQIAAMIEAGELDSLSPDVQRIFAALPPALMEIAGDVYRLRVPKGRVEFVVLDGGEL